MDNLSILTLPNAKTAGQKILWCAYAGTGFLSACLAVYVRFTQVCPMFGLNGFELIPLTGLVSGVAPHLFFRLMHNLTHPILLSVYVLGLIYLTVRIISNPPATKLAALLREVIAIMILALICAYMASIFLPVGDLVSIIKNP